MSKSNTWRTSTAFGRICCQLGSIKLAIPVMTVVTGAMVWGTWIESMEDGPTARAMVYGAGWFIALMVLVCVILTAAVITRYPWKRRHTGFIVVHASLIALIIGGFWSLFDRVEGQLWLQEGTQGHVLETSRIQIEAINPTTRQPSGDFALINPASTSAQIAGLNIRIVEHWANTGQHQDVLNDGPNPLQAIEVVLDPRAAEGMWVGETLDGQAWPRIQDFQIRMMPLGVAYIPPDPSSAGDEDFTFVVNGERRAVPEVGEELLPGWKVVSVRRFRHAEVTAEGMVEGESDHENPAIEVVLDDGQGTLERHVAYKNFPDMKIHRPVQGEADSGTSLEAPAAGGSERIVFESIDGKLRATHVAATGAINVISQPGELPWTVEFGSRVLYIRRHLDHARGDSHLVEAPAADRSRPSIVVRIEGGADQDIPLLWKNPTPVMTPVGSMTLQYGPHSVPLPFTIQLNDFRKLDYPGTANAMAYESDVTVTSDQGTKDQTIFMNNPYKYGGWKVYQSGFDGDAISVFSIMKDPGLPLTYIGCIGLCVGIFLTFYAGGLSWGHPGIPVPFTRREKPNALQTDASERTSDGGDSERAVLDRPDRLNADAVPGSNDAGGHLRQGSGGGVDGPIEVVGETRV